MNFKLKSLAYKFTLIYNPGKDHVVPDAMSRRNDSPIFGLEKLPKMPPASNNVLLPYESTFGPPSWVANPQVTALETQAEELYISQTFPTVSAIACTAINSGQTRFGKKLPFLQATL